MISIYAPYGRGEVTAAAIRVAEVAVEKGVDVRLMSVGPIEPGVHRFWDRVVRPANDLSAGAGSSQCVWFGVYPHLMGLASAFSPSAVHTLVAGKELLHAEAGTLGAYQRVVATSKHAYGALKSLAAAVSLPPSVVTTWAVWESGLPPVRRSSRVEAGVDRVLFSCDSASIDECPVAVLAAADGLLKRLDGVSITLASTKTWPKLHRRRIRGMECAWGGRFKFSGRACAESRTSQMLGHDWLVLPAVRCDFAITAGQGLACGLPVICYDLPPLNEHVFDGFNGGLVQCEEWDGGAAVASPSGLVDRCVDLMSDESTLGELRAKKWRVGRHRRLFTAFWATMFGL